MKHCSYNFFYIDMQKLQSCIIKYAKDLVLVKKRDEKLSGKARAPAKHAVWGPGKQCIILQIMLQFFLDVCACSTCTYCNLIAFLICMQLVKAVVLVVELVVLLLAALVVVLLSRKLFPVVYY